MNLIQAVINNINKTIGPKKQVKFVELELYPNPIIKSNKYFFSLTENGMEVATKEVLINPYRPHEALEYQLNALVCELMVSTNGDYDLELKENLYVFYN